MRILIVTEHFWPEAFRVNDLALGLRDRGHDVEVSTALPNYPAGRFFEGYGLRGPYRETWEGIRIGRVPVVPRGRGQAWRLAANYGSFVATAGPLLTVARRRWDCVLVFQPTPVTTILPALALSARRVPVVAWVQDLWPETLKGTGVVRSRVALRAIGALSHWLYRRCDRVLIQSPGFRAPLEAGGVESRRIGYLPNWAEELYSAPPPAPLPRQPWQGAFSAMFAGNLGRAQSLETILGAAELLREEPDCRWVFVGDGACREWLQAEVRRRRLEDRIHLVGRRPVDEMPAWFATADAMLVTLNRDPTLAMTIPSKLQSYLAAGVPVLGALDGDGARVIGESSAGFAAAAGDAPRLAANVLRMKGLSPAERARMGARGREYYEAHFSRQRCLDELARALLAAQRERQEKRRAADRRATPR
jgi:glycosyltransferase involved in cell wall biosynthesis